MPIAVSEAFFFNDFGVPHALFMAGSFMPSDSIGFRLDLLLTDFLPD